MPSPYATVADLQTYLGEVPPEGAERALVAAGRLLEGNPRVVVSYDAAGSHIAEAAFDAALRDASCAQAEYWREIGGGVFDFSADIWRLQRDGSLDGEVMPPFDVLAPRAKDILWAAGLYVSGPRAVRSRGLPVW